MTFTPLRDICPERHTSISVHDCERVRATERGALAACMNVAGALLAWHFNHIRSLMLTLYTPWQFTVCESWPLPWPHALQPAPTPTRFGEPTVAKRTPTATETPANALNPRWPWKHTRRYRTVQEPRIRPIGLAGRGNERCRGVTRSAGHCDGRGLRGGPRKRTHAFKRGRIGRTFCLYPGLPPSTELEH